MKKSFGAALALFVAFIPIEGIMAQTQEQKIWTLLDDSKSPYVSLAESDFRALGAGFDLPDGGRSVPALAEKAPGGGFDPRDVGKLPPHQLGYKAHWGVESFSPCNPDLAIPRFRPTRLD